MEKLRFGREKAKTAIAQYKRLKIGLFIRHRNRISFFEKKEKKSFIFCLNKIFILDKVVVLHLLSGGLVSTESENERNVNRGGGGMKKGILLVVLSLALGYSMANADGIVRIDAEESEPYLYYYDQLSMSERKFYRAIGEMDLKKGNDEYDLIESETVTEAQLSRFTDGNADLLKEFGAAKDAYYLDHPEIFYVDFDALSISVGLKNGNYVATLGTGRADTYFSNGFDQTNVAAAIEEYESGLKRYSFDEDAAIEDIVTSVNNQMVEEMVYGFDGNQIRSSYGSLVDHYGVCESYARGFKSLMDRCQIPCVEVVGYLLDSDSNTYQPHAWNAVRIDGNWYGVDVTLNDSTGQIDGYLLKGSDMLSLDHLEDGKISESGKSFTYPSLSEYDLGKAPIKAEVKYEKTEDGGYSRITVSYMGKSVRQLKDEGLYLVDYSPDALYKGFASYALDSYLSEDGYTFNFEFNDWITKKYIVTSQIPDTDGIYYHQEIEEIIAESATIVNECYDKDRDVPFVSDTIVDGRSQVTWMVDANQTHSVSLVYDTELEIFDPDQPIGIRVSSDKDSSLSEYVVVEDISLKNQDEKGILSFTLIPSKMYQHNTLAYTFTPVNVIKKDSISEKNPSGLAPLSASLAFGRRSVVCSKIFNDGRLYVDAYGSPSLIDCGDLSMNGWTYTENGIQKGIVDNQRSQMALVVTKPTERVEEQMKTAVSSDSETLLVSETYEIDLHICGFLAEIPSGSYVKVAFGFPEGYGPDDEGVTFKVYHFEKKNGVIDYENPIELECVVTSYGLVVETDNFSPFMVAVVKSEGDLEESKRIYARTVNAHGSFQTESMKSIASLQSGESLTYTITPDEGYRIDYVLLNGKQVECENNRVILSYEQINAQNTLDIAFVSEVVAERESREGIENQNVAFAENYYRNQKKNQHLPNVLKWIFIGIGVFAGLVLLAMLLGFFFRKRTSN